MPPAAERLAWKRWPDGSAVFDRALGHTHILNCLTSAVLHAKLQAPSASVERIREMIVPAGNEAVPSLQEIAESLTELQRIELL
ncbi:MAG TPA: hypothetical protein VD932_06990 [Aquabacterium sp.]|nr:hypothetical protein [Aquabacterium sp.]